MAEISPSTKLARAKNAAVAVAAVTVAVVVAATQAALVGAVTKPAFSTPSANSQRWHQISLRTGARFAVALRCAGGPSTTRQISRQDLATSAEDAGHRHPNSRRPSETSITKK